MRALHVLGDPAAVLYALNAERGPMYVMNGDADQMVAKNPPAWFAAVREQAVELRGTDENMFTTVLYPGIGHRPSWFNRDGVEWLDQQIILQSGPRRKLLPLRLHISASGPSRMG